MAQTSLSVRVSPEDKRLFETFCEQTGMNVSVAVNIFIKAVIREQKIPFEVKTDPFYSEANIARLKKAVAEANKGKLKAHELIEVADD